MTGHGRNIQLGVNPQNKLTFSHTGHFVWLSRAHAYVSIKDCLPIVLFIGFDSLHPSQQSSS